MQAGKQERGEERDLRILVLRRGFRSEGSGGVGSQPAMKKRKREEIRPANSSFLKAVNTFIGALSHYLRKIGKYF